MPEDELGAIRVGTGNSSNPAVSWKDQDALSKLNYSLVGDYDFDYQTRRYISLSFLILAVIIGCGSYTQSGIFRNTIVNFRPDLYSGLLAIGFVAALHVRRLIPASFSAYFLLSFCLNTSVTAIVVQGLLGTAILSGLIMKIAVPAALLMTWLGIRAIAPLIWLAVIAFGSFNLSSMGNAMGVWGFGFLLLTVLGILMQVKLNSSNIKDSLIYDFTGRLPDNPEQLALLKKVEKRLEAESS